MSRRVTFGLALIAMAVASPVLAAAVRPGASIFSIQFSHGVADLVGPDDGGGYLGAYDHSEWGARAEFWKMMGPDYAFNVSGGVGWFEETDKPGDNALPDSPELRYEQKSWHVRVGGDRVVNLGDRAALYFGPGIEYWSGSATFENIFSAPSLESPTTTRISLYGRIGGLLSVGKSWGLTGHVGHRIGYATASAEGAESTWWPSGYDAASGIMFTFGGSE
jgi:hypothetical protein